MDNKEIKKALMHPAISRRLTMEDKRKEEIRKAWAELEANWNNRYRTLATEEQRQIFIEDQCRYLGIKSSDVCRWIEKKEHKQ